MSRDMMLSPHELARIERVQRREADRLRMADLAHRLRALVAAAAHD